MSLDAMRYLDRIILGRDDRCVEGRQRERDP